MNAAVNAGTTTVPMVGARLRLRTLESTMSYSCSPSPAVLLEEASALDAAEKKIWIFKVLFACRLVVY